MTVWPSTGESLSASARASTSVVPPAGTATISVTGLFGQAWAIAGGRASALRTAKASACAARRRCMVMGSLLSCCVVVVRSGRLAPSAGPHQLAHRLGDLLRGGLAAQVAGVQRGVRRDGLDGVH